MNRYLPSRVTPTTSSQGDLEPISLNRLPIGSVAGPEAIRHVLVDDRDARLRSSSCSVNARPRTTAIRIVLK